LKELATKTGKGIHDSKLVGQVGHKLKVGSGTNLELYDYEEEKGARYDPLQRYPKRPAPNQIVRRDRHLRHSHIGPAVFIEERGAGFYIHGYPPCNIHRCIVLVHPWDELLRALARETKVSVYVEY
jgi:hypothetical protein